MTKCRTSKTESNALRITIDRMDTVADTAVGMVDMVDMAAADSDADHPVEEAEDSTEDLVDMAGDTDKVAVMDRVEAPIEGADSNITNIINTGYTITPYNKMIQHKE